MQGSRATAIALLQPPSKHPWTCSIWSLGNRRNSGARH
jgi:hypothetical protein